MNNQAEKRICKNCEGEFLIFVNDFNFYEKIGVPDPTFCPECRYIRRLLDRNEYNFYKRKCDATSKDIISIYRQDMSFPVYEQEYWKSDKFDATQYGRDFDFNRSFFEQYEELRRLVPHIAMVNSNSVNSEYTNQAEDNKDCYMLVKSGNNEKCIYGSWCDYSFFCSDCYMINKCEFCYECLNMTNCSNCLWSQDLANCVNVYFSNDCRGCTDCFGCIGLRNKKNCWFNEQLIKEEYAQRIKDFSLNAKSIQETVNKTKILRLSLPFKYYHGFQAQNFLGDYVENIENARAVFNCRDHKDTAYMQDAWFKTADCLDCTEIIIGELSYEIQGVAAPTRTIVARSCHGSITDSYYCDMCFSAQDCFGCFGLKQKQYCIFNKQYTKEQYFELKKRIIEHMRQTKEWGEYFPPKYSPFAYNESMAQDYFPLTKEEALEKGYQWYDRPERHYENAKDVVKCKTQDEKDKRGSSLCTTAFRVTDLELTLYKKLGIPIPEYCFPCRRAERFKLRNPRKLWRRVCMCNKDAHFHGGNKCEVEFETSYAPDRPEIIYCEKCYQAEVY